MSPLEHQGMLLALESITRYGLEGIFASKRERKLPVNRLHSQARVQFISRYYNAE
jgi:hypothetical protein